MVQPASVEGYSDALATVSDCGGKLANRGRHLVLACRAVHHNPIRGEFSGSGSAEARPKSLVGNQEGVAGLQRLECEGSWRCRHRAGFRAAEFVLRTSLQTNRASVTLIAELINFADHRVVWREMFQRQLAIFIDTQDVLASAIVSPATRQARQLVLPSAEDSYTWARERWSSGDLPG